MDVGPAHYITRDYVKHEILLLYTCLLYLYLTPDWVGQYLGIYHNNVTQTYSTVDNDI